MMLWKVSPHEDGSYEASYDPSLVSGLRRSKRKSCNLNLFMTPPPTVKKKKQEPRVKNEAKQVCLTSLPRLVLEKLLQFLDVPSLHNLSVTCSLFDQLIAGQYIISINIPFPTEFLSELKSVSSIEKKPLLKIECRKFENYRSKDLQMLVGVELGYCPNILEYLLGTQLSLLDLGKLREIDLIQGNLDASTQDMEKLHSFDEELLHQIKWYVNCTLLFL